MIGVAPPKLASTRTFMSVYIALGAELIPRTRHGLTYVAASTAIAAAGGATVGSISRQAVCPDPPSLALLGVQQLKKRQR